MYIENNHLKNQISNWLIFMFWIIALMIVVGGLTRLTDSGLSITKWQLFSGFLPPLNKDDWILYFNLYKEIPEYKIQNYDMSLSEFKVNYILPLSFSILIFCQIVIGAFVSGMDAGKIYNSWPLMGTTYFPNDNNFINLLNLNAFNDPSLVQFIHRNLAYIILLFYIFLLIKIYKEKFTHLYKLTYEHYLYYDVL